MIVTLMVIMIFMFIDRIFYNLQAITARESMGEKLNLD